MLFRSETVMAGRGAAATEIPSSPPRRESSRLLSPPRRSNGRERRNPSITPRKFKRFFTPRERVPSHLSSGHISPARRALRDLAGPELNNRYQTPAPSSPLKAPYLDEQSVSPQFDNGHIYDARAKRRKLQHTPDSSPFRAQLLEAGHLGIKDDTEPALLSPIRSLPLSQETDEAEESEEELEEGSLIPVSRIAPLPSRGLHGRAKRSLRS